MTYMGNNFGKNAKLVGMLENLKYYYSILNLAAFRARPLRTLLRSVLYYLKKMVGIDSIIKIKFGEKNFKMRITPSDKHTGSASIFIQREYYEPLLQHGHDLIRDGMAVIDCGANQGIYTLAYGSLFPRVSKVISFEPVPEMFSILERNVLLNDMQNICILNQAAVSDKGGSERLDLSKGVVSASIERSFGDNTITVNALTIDETLEKLGFVEKVGLIKLDIEGAELRALYGASKTLRESRPNIIFDTLSHNEWEALSEYLSKEGYEYYYWNDGNLVKLEDFKKLSNLLCVPV